MPFHIWVPDADHDRLECAVCYSTDYFSDYDGQCPQQREE